MRKGHRCFHHDRTPGAVLLTMCGARYEVSVMTAAGREPFHVDAHGNLHWLHPAAVPRRLKKLAARAYRQKRNLDARLI